MFFMFQEDLEKNILQFDKYNRRHLELDTFIFGSIRVDACIKTLDRKELGFGTLFQEIILNFETLSIWLFLQWKAVWYTE